MNLKKLVISILIVLSLVLLMGAVSAENSTDTAIADTSNSTADVAADNTPATTQTTQASTQSTQKSAPVKKIDVDVDADDAVVPYKKNSYFKVKVKEDDTNKPLKNIKVKIKVFTKSKSKIYTIKTNSKGIAKFNTKILKKGDHKVIVTSADPSCKFKETAHIFVGKKHTITLKPNTSKKLKNKDVIRVKVKNDDDEKEIKVSFKGKAKKTNIIKAVFYLKNKYTGKVIKKVDYSDFDDGRWQYPEEDYANKYVAVKIKISYVTV